MRFLKGISRILIGVVFIVSGFLKALDPVGTSLKIKEYLGAMNLNFLDLFATPGAIILCCIEFLIGIAILKGLRIRLFSVISLVFTLFFTVITLCSATFLPVKDCGCFGEAIHLTNWQTLGKNVLLLVAAVVIYRQRSSFAPIATKFWQNIYLGAYSLFILATTLYSLFFLPLADFGQFKPGTDLIANLSENQLKQFKTVIIYSKDGVEEEFTLDNLPDSTWSYVDTKSVLIAEGSSSNIDFSIRDNRGNTVTDSILNLNSPLVFVSVYKNLSNKKHLEIEQMESSVTKAGGKLFVLSASNEKPNISLPVYSSDHKTLLSLNRSNGGLTYVYEGIIVKKWSRRNYPTNMDNIFGQSPNILIADTIIQEQLFIEFSLALLIFMVIIIRSVSKRIYKNHLKRLKSQSEAKIHNSTEMQDSAEMQDSTEMHDNAEVQNNAK